MQETVYLGGYTRSTGQGIYRAILDTTKQQLTTPTPLVTTVDGPTYLAVNGDKMYAVAAGDGTGGVAAIDLAGTPHVINSVLLPGTSPAYVAVDAERRLVYAANYHMGRIDVFVIRDDGGLALASSNQCTGSGPRPEQEESHVHYTDLTPDRRLVVCDLGADTVTTYDVDVAGQIRPVATFATAAGFGPRHIVFHPTLPVAYLLGELASELQVLDYDAAAGTFSARERLSTLPPDWHGQNGAAAVRISQDGRFLYTSNRGHNSITVWAIDAGGDVTPVQHITTAGEFPRDINIDPSGDFVVAVNQNTNNATVYRRDNTTGLLTIVQQGIVAPEAVNVTFA